MDSFFNNFEYQGSNDVPGKFIIIIPSGSGKEVYFVVFAILSNVRYLGFLT